MVILALRCIVKDHRHRNLHHFVRRPSIGLARQQQPDGSFGGLRATTLALQALQDATELTDYWNKTLAVTWILSRQGSDGSFGNVAATADVLSSLSARGLSAVRDLDCGHSYPDTGLENHGNVKVSRIVLPFNKNISSRTRWHDEVHPEPRQRHRCQERHGQLHALGGHEYHGKLHGHHNGPQEYIVLQPNANGRRYGITFCFSG